MPFTKLYNKLLNRNQKQDRFTSGHTDTHMSKTIMPLALSGAATIVFTHVQIYCIIAEN